MNPPKKNTHTNKQSESQATGIDPVAVLQQVERSMPQTEPMTVAQIRDLRTIERRAPAKLIELVLTEAEASGGNVAGIPLDVASVRSDAAQAAKLRVGASSARSIAQYMEQQALLLASGVAQRALSATTSLASLARTPEGRTSARKANELLSARPKRKRKPKATTETGQAPAPAPAEASPAPPVATHVATPPAPSAST
jgi:hypothetical protein